MRAPLEWIREFAAIPLDVSAEEVAHRLTMLDLKLEQIDVVGAEIVGPLVVGRVLSFEAEDHSNGKTIRWCHVDVGSHNVDGEPRGIVCGAGNFAEGDLIVASLPGASLPGGFHISARKTYGHVSDGMICSSPELGLPGDDGGILILDDPRARPGDDAIALLGLRTEVLDLEVNPDRGYALSLRGVARDAALAFGVGYTDPADVQVTAAAGEDYPVEVDDLEGCHVFVTRTVTGFDASRPTPRWMARRIALAGMRPISLAVDITNYVMLELGQPIHGYDRSNLQGPIVVRRAVDGEKLTTLDGVVRSLSPADLLITDDRGPIGLAGVMGGADVELGPETTDIVIEAANFDAPTIARAARVHKLPSEASKRFERGVDPALAAVAAQRVADLLVEHGGGAVVPGITRVGNVPAMPTVQFAEDLPARVTGVAISADQAVQALVANGCSVEVHGESIHATPPTWRPDLTDPFDFVEDVLRVVGYDEVPSVLPTAPAGRGLTRAQQLRRRISRVASGAGYVEVKTFPFAGPADWDKLGLPADDVRRRQAMLENPLSAQEPGLTTMLLSGLLSTLALNVGRGHSDVAIFETGRVFHPQPGAVRAPIPGVDRRPTDDEFAALDGALPAQPHHLAFVLVGNRDRSGWWGDGREVSWSDAVESVREVARALHTDIKVRAADLAPWHPGRCAEIAVGDQVIGYAGELHPRVAAAYGLHGRVAGAEIDSDLLIAASPQVVLPPEFSTFPVAKEDIALVVDASVSASSVRDALAGASDLIESVRLFDSYSGGQLPEGKKSLAFALRMRARDRTLTDGDILSVRQAALTATADQFGAALRS